MKLMYITNAPEIAKIALDAGVDILFIDMEYLGKEERQKNMNTVKNHHTVEDVKNMRKVIDSCDKSKELLVRVNPVHRNSEEEINAAIECGADIVMLPMWKSVEEVKKFVRIVSGKAKICLLLETKEAAEIIDDVLEIGGIDIIYIGLNDLHLSYGNKFMFEPLANGTVDMLVEKIAKTDIEYGFGGIAKIGEGAIPAERILAEHIRLGSGMVILSRAFCSTSGELELEKIEADFEGGVANLRKKEQELKLMDSSFLFENHKELDTIVNEIVRYREM